MAHASLRCPSAELMKSPQHIPVHSISYSLAVIIAINNHDVAEARRLLELDPNLLEDYEPIVSFLNQAGNDFAHLTRTEQLRHHFFAQMINEHLLNEKVKNSRKLAGISTCIVTGGLLSSVSALHRTFSLPGLIEKSQSLLHDPNILGPFGLAFVSLEFTLLALRLKGVKNPFNKKPIEERSLFSTRAIAAGFDAGRIALRYIAYGLLLAVGATVSSACMGLLVVGEALNVAKHITDWRNDCRHTQQSCLSNRKQLYQNEQALLQPTPFETKITLTHSNFQILNADVMLSFDLNRKKSAIKVNAAYSALLVGTYAFLLFCPLSFPIVLGVSLAVFIGASVLRSYLLKKIDREQDQTMTRCLKHNEERYRSSLSSIFKAEQREEPKVSIELHPSNRKMMALGQSEPKKPQLKNQLPYIDELKESFQTNHVSLGISG